MLIFLGSARVLLNVIMEVLFGSVVFKIGEERHLNLQITAIRLGSLRSVANFCKILKGGGAGWG